ncbi:MAG: hypothetical protein AAF602_32910, partial [Myxococcota bacterium]
SISPDAITQPGQCQAGDPLNQIGTLGLVPGAEGPKASTGLRILVGIDGKSGPDCADAGCSDPSCIDIRRRVTFIPNQSLLLPIAASRNCLGLCCEDGKTCVDGTCAGNEDPLCDPAVEECEPPDPSPPIGQRWAFGVPDRGFDIVATKARVSSDGRLVVVVAGTYDVPPNNTAIDFGGVPLLPGEGSGVFMARIAINPSGEGAVDTVASCVGLSPALHDVDFDASGAHALLTTGDRLECANTANISLLNEQSRIPFLWNLNPTDPELTFEPLHSGAGGQPATLPPPETTESIAFGVDNAGNGSVLHVAGVHVGGPAALRREGAAQVPLPPASKPRVYRATLGTSISTVDDDELWMLGAPQDTGFEQVESHQVLQVGVSTTWHVGLFNGRFEPLGVGDVRGSSVFAVPGTVPDVAMVATGGIDAITRARRRRSTENVLVAATLDVANAPDLIVGEADPIPLAGRSVALVEFAPGSARLVLQADGEHADAAGTEALVCMAFDRDGEGVMACEDRPEVRFGEQVE